MKGCSLRLEELQNWVVAETQSDPTFCPECKPDQAIESDGEVHLTKLDRDILDYILEIADYHMEADDHAYGVTVGMTARCLGKTEGQLMASLGRLVTDGLLELAAPIKPGEILPPRCRIAPTAKALRTIPAYAEVSDRNLAAELRKLQ
jgi:hypothetical protein